MADISKIKPNGASGDEYEIKDTTARAGVLHLNAVTQSTKTVTGNPITVTDAAPINAEGLSMTVEPIQDLHGYDKPWVGGAGKNKLEMNYSTATVNGVTGTLNYDGSIEFNGKATGGNATFILALGNLLSPLLNKSLILNGNPLTSGGRLQWWNYDGNGTTAVDRGNGTDAFTPTSQNGNVAIVIEENTECNHLIFYPMIRLSTETDPTFEQYENKCPISGISTARVDDVGKNSIYTNRVGETTHGVTFTPNDDGTVSVSGTATGLAAFLITSNTTPCEIDINESYILNGLESVTNIQWNSAELYDANNHWVHGYTVSGKNPITFTDFSDYPDAKYLVVTVKRINNVACSGIIKPMLRLANITDDTYVPYQQPTQAAVSFGETVYGAEIDFNTGKAVVTHEIKEFDGSVDEDWSYEASNKVYIPANNLIKVTDYTTRIICDRLQTIAKKDTAGFYNYCITAYSDPNNIYPNQNWIYLKNKDCTSVSDFRTWLASNPLQVCYELATPYTLNLTPAQLKMLKGTNTLTCNGATITLKYQPDNVVGELKGEIRAVEAELAEVEENLEIVYEDHVANTSMGIIVDGYSVGDMPFSNALDIAKTGYIPIAVTDTSVVSSTVADQGEIATHCLLDVTNNRVRFYVHVMDSAASLTIPPNSLTFRVAYKKA